MIKLINIDDSPVYLNPKHVVGVYGNDSYTSVHTGGENAYAVKESAEEVVKMILEYKFSSRDYKGTLIESDSIYSLAGLE